MTTTKVETGIEILPWLYDHRFAGRPVLPAVESLVVLAGAVQKEFPEVNICSMTEAGFPRFLEIPENANWLDCVLELQSGPDQTLRARLYSRRQLGKFSRMIEHASACFGDTSLKTIPLPAPPTRSPGFALAGKKIYEELVPFGPAYRNVIHADLFADGASASLLTPAHCTTPSLHGSPFLLDSAMHVACVWGQRFAGFVPFPVGFSSRRILAPSRPETEYKVVMFITKEETAELAVNMDISEKGGKPVEQVRGLLMRDVSGGRWLPPDWIQADGNG